jgi:hypothetical protein
MQIGRGHTFLWKMQKLKLRRLTTRALVVVMCFEGGE